MRKLIFASTLLLACSPGVYSPVSDSTAAATIIGEQETSPETQLTLPEPPAASYSVNLKVDPPDYSGYMPQQLLNQVLTAELPQKIRYKKTAYHLGKCIQEIELPQSELSMYLAEQNDDIYGTNCDVVVTPKEEAGAENSWLKGFKPYYQTTAKQNGEFKFKLLSGQLYDLIVNSQGKNNEPPYFFETQVELDSQKILNLGFNHHEVIGSISIPAHLSSDREFKETFTVKVKQNGTLVSSVSNSVQAGEEFRVQITKEVVRKSDGPFILEVSPTSSRSILPSFTKNIHINPASAYTVVDCSEYQAIKPLARLKISLIADEFENFSELPIYIQNISENFSYRVKLVPDVAGNIEVEVPIGSYAISVLPLVDMPLESYSVQDLNIQKDKDLTINMKKKEATEIFFYQGETPVEKARVEIKKIPLSNIEPEILKDLNVMALTTTDKNGKLCSNSGGSTSEKCHHLYLDAGDYVLMFKPPTGSTLPYFSKAMKIVPGNKYTVQTPGTREYRGKLVTYDEKKHIADSYIKIYSISKNPYFDEYFLIGEAFTDEEGFFSSHIADKTFLDTLN